jgi:hypothetical protein
MQTKKIISVEAVSHVICDRCGSTADVEDMEAQEYLHVNFTGGYSSVFGDGSEVRLDLCQNCVRDTLGGLLRVTPGGH